MNTEQKETYDRGERVGLAMKPYQLTIADFAPLAVKITNIKDLTAALYAKSGGQDGNSEASTAGKDAKREVLAQGTDLLSKRMLGYAKVQEDVELVRKFTLTYADVRYGEENEDIHHVEQLLKDAAQIPEADRTAFRITEELIEDVTKKLDDFKAAGSEQTTTKEQKKLATQSIPVLVKSLQKELNIAATLVEGMANEPAPWPEIVLAYAGANKVQKVAPSRRQRPATRTVATMDWTQSDSQPKNFGKKVYAMNYELVVENHSNTEAVIWLAVDKSGKPADGFAPLKCAPGVATTVKREEMGPELAQYLFARFEGAEGGKAKIKVRKVV